MLTVLIACYDGWNTLAEVPFVLKMGGFKVDILCKEGAWVKQNSFYDNWIPTESDEDYCRQLQQLTESKHYDWVIAGDDKLIKVLNETITDEAIFKKLLPLTKIENREMLSSKTGFSNICQKYQIRTPGYQHFEATGNLANFSCKLQFPLIIKVDFSWGGTGIKILNTEAELQTALADVPPNESAIIQEYIIGKEVPVEALFWQGKLLAVTSSEILEYDKDQFSYSTRRRYFPIDEMLKNAIATFGEAAGIHGFVNMAYIKADVSQQYYIIEADPRPSSWTAYARFSGNSFADALQSITSPEKTVIKGAAKTVEIALFHKDVRRALYKHEVKGLLRWVFKPSYWRYIPFYDPKLFFFIIRMLWREFVIEKMQRSLKTAKT